jgi:hypothetical protein
MADSPRRLQVRNSNTMDNSVPQLADKANSSLVMVIPAMPPPAEYDQPHTPSRDSFMSAGTPQGSPSKNRAPPGSKLVPDVKTPFTTNAGKNLAQIQNINQPLSPFDEKANKNNTPGSPVRRSNKENTPPASLLAKEVAGLNFRDESSLPQPRMDYGRGTTKRFIDPKGLSSEDLIKIQQPQMKRIATAVQLCKFVYKCVLTNRLPRPLPRPFQLCTQPPKPHRAI